MGDKWIHGGKGGRAFSEVRSEPITAIAKFDARIAELEAEVERLRAGRAVFSSPDDTEAIQAAIDKAEGGDGSVVLSVADYCDLLNEVERRGRLIERAVTENFDCLWCSGHEGGSHQPDCNACIEIHTGHEPSCRAFTPDGSVRWGEPPLSDEEKQHREAGKFRHGDE